VVVFRAQIEAVECLHARKERDKSVTEMKKIIISKALLSGGQQVNKTGVVWLSVATLAGWGLSAANKCMNMLYTLNTLATTRECASKCPRDHDTSANIPACSS
jgi:hypothetical protein